MARKRRCPRVPAYMMHIALKTAVLTFATVLSAVSFIFLRNPEREPLPSVHAANGGVLSGWAWSDLPNGSAGSGGGWISFSSRNCDGDGDGFAGPNAPGACPPEGTGLALYEVSVSNSGTVSGYAWSEHVGWISFNQSAVDNCPSGSCRGALDTDTGAVMGWARACAVFANGCSGALGPESKRGGWEGWVSLSCANAGVCATSDYGVSSGSGDPCDWDGWAWGDAILGWIHVKGPTYGVQGTGDACVPPPAPPVIDQPNGVINATEFDVQLSTVGPGTYEGDVDVRATNPDGSVVDWSNAGLPNGGSLVDTFSFVGVPGKKYEFRFRARRGIGPWSDRATDGAVVINRPPDAPTPTTPVSGVNTYTLFPASPLTPILSWLFSDPDTAGWHDSGSSGTNPGAHTDADREGVNYQVEIYRNAALTDRVCCPANARIASGLEFNRNYYWRVRTTDNHDLSSSFGRAAEGGSCVGGAACAFHTPPSAPPVAAFTFAPVSPIIGAPITFTDQSYDPGPPNEGNGDTGDTFGCPSGDCRVVSWNWTFGPTARRADNGTPIPSWSGKTPPAIVFPDRGTTAVTLQVTDNDGQSVATAKDVMVQPKLPIFKEIRPR